MKRKNYGIPDTAEVSDAETPASDGIWFSRGVYAVFANGEHSNYYCFENESQGSMMSIKKDDENVDPNTLTFGGLGFTCEQTNDCVYMHFPFTQSDWTWKDISKNSDGDIVIKNDDGSDSVIIKLDVDYEDFANGTFERVKLDLSDIRK